MPCMRRLARMRGSGTYGARQKAAGLVGVFTMKCAFGCAFIRCRAIVRNSLSDKNVREETTRRFTISWKGTICVLLLWEALRPQLELSVVPRAIFLFHCFPSVSLSDSSSLSLPPRVEARENPYVL